MCPCHLCMDTLHASLPRKSWRWQFKRMGLLQLSMLRAHCGCQRCLGSLIPCTALPGMSQSSLPAVQLGFARRQRVQMRRDVKASALVDAQLSMAVKASIEKKKHIVHIVLHHSCAGTCCALRAHTPYQVHNERRDQSMAGSVAGSACRNIGLDSNLSSAAPLVATNAGPHIALQISSDVIALYQAVDASDKPGKPAMQIDWVRWLRPIMLLGMLVVGSTYFARAKSAGSAGRFGSYGGAMAEQQRIEAILRAQRRPGQGSTGARQQAWQ